MLFIHIINYFINILAQIIDSKIFHPIVQIFLLITNFFVLIYTLLNIRKDVHNYKKNAKHCYNFDLFLFNVLKISEKLINCSIKKFFESHELKFRGPDLAREPRFVKVCYSPFVLLYVILMFEFI